MTKHNLTPADRIKLHTSIDAETGCWNWTGTISHSGYGRLCYQYREWPAHRFAYTHLVGPIPGGLELDHLCVNRRCVNPEHLEPVTTGENVRRARQIGYDHPNAPKTCRRGHDLAVVGVIEWASGGRSGRNCRACRRVNRQSATADAS